MRSLFVGKNLKARVTRYRTQRESSNGNPVTHDAYYGTKQALYLICEDEENSKLL